MIYYDDANQIMFLLENIFYAIIFNKVFMIHLLHKKPNYH